ncbi:MAG: DNA/RNA nuclease SfsA [Gammaproteobacteria bacterium]|jgi:sugar fermentation stimulation protein A
MKFSEPLVQGTLIRRYKRFLLDVQLDSGEQITAHTSNTGSMLGCQDPGSRVWLSRSDNPKRKYQHSWEIVEVDSLAGPVPVGINTMLSNKLVHEAISTGLVGNLQGYQSIRTEVKYGIENSRIDLFLEPFKGEQAAEHLPRNPCYVEVKNVTLVKDGVAYFPDAVSKRGAKHLRELIEVVRNGDRGVIFFCVQRSDACQVKPADHIDPEYGQWLRRAVKEGVEAMAYRAEVTPYDITLVKNLPVNLDNS